ncbi:hypothetical protein DSM3645_02878 [Blastopirellula marina DSM 3645]|uniref:Uncharacterized protein n=1 Tax=Blastopirellula marina DSM 3645 TaxID=314230 RepID=A3ZVN9_9BACT|nr:hypothetical protein DSM3645_02878 [Blastopirellula marina DSM 3645]
MRDFWFQRYCVSNVAHMSMLTARRRSAMHLHQEKVHEEILC